jgi:hypothetical protein
MGGGVNQHFFVAALLGAWGSLGLTIVHAGEPFTKVLRGGSAHSAAGARLPAGPPTDRPTGRPTGRLDLTPPPALAARSAEAQNAVESFPAPKRSNGVMAETQAKWANLSSPADSQRISSRAEQLARNFHRDGLPVARLFQSQNALVHIGLNQKGKPGLWIIERLH